MPEVLEFSFSKNYTVAAMIALLVQLGGWVWWASSQAAQLNELDHRLVSIETKHEAVISKFGTAADRVSRLEDRASDVAASIKDINAHLGAIETYLNTSARQPREVK